VPEQQALEPEGEGEATPTLVCVSEAREAGQESLLVREVKEQMKMKFRSCREAFEAINVTKDGFIDRQQFQIFLRKVIGLDNTKTITELFDELDDDGDGHVSIAEFKAHFCEPGDDRRRGSVTSIDGDSQMLKERRGSFSRRGSAASLLSEEPRLKERRNSFVRRGSLTSVDGEEQEGRPVYTRRGSASSMDPEPDRKRRSIGPEFVAPGLERFRNFMKAHYAGAKEAFAQLDKNGDRQLDQEEVAQLLTDLSYPGDVDEVFAGLDKNGDGAVSWEEFKCQIRSAAAMRRCGSTESCAAAGA